MPCDAAKTTIVTAAGETIVGHIPHWATCPKANKFKEGTTTIQDKVEQLKKEFANQIAELEKQLAEENKLSKVWKPKKGEKYYVLELNGGATEYSWKDNVFDKVMYQRGNCFKTKEEAEWADQHRIVATELKNFVAENDPRPITKKDWWDGSIEKSFLFFDYSGQKIGVTSLCSSKEANNIYASNQEVLRSAIKHIGEDRLKKYYFEVE